MTVAQAAERMAVRNCRTSIPLAALAAPSGYHERNSIGLGIVLLRGV
jgi:hypothetical protein